MRTGERASGCTLSQSKTKAMGEAGDFRRLEEGGGGKETRPTRQRSRSHSVS